MNPAEQGVGRGTRDAQRRDPAVRRNEAGRDAQATRQEQPLRNDAGSRERTDARPARGPAGASERRDAKVAATGSSAKREAPAQSKATPPAAEARVTLDTAAASESEQAATALPATAPAGSPASDPSAAASLAALLPNVAALPSAPAAGDTDGIPQEAALLDGAGSRTGASLLEKLIAEAGGRIASADGSEAGAGASPANDEGSPAAASDKAATIGLPWKADGDAVATDASTGRAAPAGATALAANSTIPQPETQLGLHAAGVTPTGRVEQPLPQLPVTTPAGQPAWAEDVGGRLVWMVGRHESKAEIVLTPPTLGKLEVSIHVGADQATAHFVAATSAARDALEQAMPRLREVLQQAGINLGQTNVSTSGEQQAQQHAPGRQNGSRSVSGGLGEIESAGAPAATRHWVRSGSGVVDTFV
ncbi:MAG: flagellar hook-length control protein FliK [Aromatoleum sp.]|uniref:flagellar hook-length control protein FliK n=1 Tax=Aromatoleum sp. TaxID=2307007 RepID=UPI0028959839|nr:flagellar hook-length control protein FliK [Aromatoleum sp.]MDT3668905.1 flagellar hook-length control protein FliK [Aromatoleum sp.]